MAHFPEWTTGSLDLAGNAGKSPISHELVVHSPEWTTGSFDLAGKGVKTPISHELVVHFLEWTTGSSDFAGKGGKSPISHELVVHFLEWTIGSFDLAGNQGKMPISHELVDHWLHALHLNLQTQPTQKGCPHRGHPFCHPYLAWWTAMSSLTRSWTTSTLAIWSSACIRSRETGVCWPLASF